MASSTLNIVLPEPFKTYVEAYVMDGSYASPTEYIQRLILDEQRDPQINLQSRLTEDSDEGSIEIPHEILERGEIVDFLEQQQAKP